MINYDKMAKWHNVKYSLKYFYSKNKFQIFTLVFIIILLLLTGLFTALKISDLEKAMKVAEFSFEAISEGKIYEFSYFIKRCLSILLMLGLLFVFSLSKWCCFLSYILIGYRAFLITLNCVLLIRYVGISGIIILIFIILPCQILQLLIMSLLFIVFIANKKEKQECGGVSNGYLKTLIVLLSVSFLLNVIELLLLYLFKATTILVL